MVFKTTNRNLLLLTNRSAHLPPRGHPCPSVWLCAWGTITANTYRALAACRPCFRRLHLLTHLILTTTNEVKVIVLPICNRWAHCAHGGATQAVRAEAGLNAKCSGVQQLHLGPSPSCLILSTFSPPSNAPSLLQAKESPRDLMGNSNSWIPPQRIIIKSGMRSRNLYFIKVFKWFWCARLLKKKKIPSSPWFISFLFINGKYEQSVI